MTKNLRGWNGLVVVGTLGLAFSAGYKVRANGESGWIPPSGAPVITLGDNPNGQRLVDRDPHGIHTATKPAYKPSLKPYETLDEVRRDIRDNFVKTKIDDTELTYGAIRGMLRSLGDRFTRFLTPEEYEKFNEQTTGQFEGIGARIDIIDEYNGSPAAKPYGASRPYIVEAIAGGPAEKAGLMRDDVLLQINGKSTSEMSEDAVVAFIRGERGSIVKLKIERKLKAAAMNRDALYKDFDVDLKRDVIEMHPVKLEWLPNRIAWLRLGEFNKKSDAEMTAALKALEAGPSDENGKSQGPGRGLIFDMRDNPGGLLDAAVDIGSRFIADGPIVITRERDGSEHPLQAEKERFMNFKIPIVVLVNNYSASAAEIVTGALKDKGIATVMGEQSYGKASVQVLLTLKNGGALIITTAKYLTPAKRDISDRGIAPDVVVKASAEDEKTGRGAQLQKAVAFIQERNTATALAARPH
jgi:carboxyl-terminal processing protease